MIYFHTFTQVIWLDNLIMSQKSENFTNKYIIQNNYFNTDRSLQLFCRLMKQIFYTGSG